MPASDTSDAETAETSAAAPNASISSQLQERLDRERRIAAIARQMEYRDILDGIQRDCDDLRQRMRRSV